MTLVWISDSGGSRGGASGGPGPPLIFRPNWWGLKGWKKNFSETVPHPLSKVRMTRPPLSPSLDLALSDTKYHKILRNLSLNRYAMWWFFTNVSLIVLRDWKKALFYHPQPCSEKLRNKARQETKLLQFLRTKWAPCDKLKGPSRALTDYNLFLYLLFLSDLYQQTLVLKQHL